MALPSVRVINAPTTTRRLRRPQHPFQLEVRPWQIQPMLIAPVLPGETMKNLLLQSRVVSSPIKNPLTGWWCEYYIFYVKHRDLEDRDTYTAMMLDPSTSLAGLFTATDVKTYHQDTRMDWVKKCLKRVTECYFRNDGEAWNTNVIDTLPVANISITSGIDSADTQTNMHAAAVDPDVVDTADSGANLSASEVDVALRTYRLMQGEGLTQMTYEDFLATYGVRPSSVELHMPELVRYTREWTYPTSVIDPTTGAPSSAVSWKIAERADKDRFFKEPGFLFGVQVVRPKVYLSNLRGSLTQLMVDAYSWLPAVLSDDQMHSWKQEAALSGPLKLNTDAYWVDVKDLFLYGEQFLNFDPTTAAKSAISLPTAAMQRRYADGTMADTLFSAASPANTIRSDGIVSLSILGHQSDTSSIR